MKKEGIESFIFYAAYAEKFTELTDEQFGKLVRHMCEYRKTGEVPEIKDGFVRLAFNVVKYDIDHNSEKYEETCEKRRQAIQERWGKKEDKKIQTNTNDTKVYKSIQNIQKYTNDTYNENENVNENVNVNDNENGDENDNENVCSSNIYNNNIGHAGTEERQAAALKFRGKHQNVLLSDDQIEDLKANYPKLYKAKIEYLSEWKKKNPTFQGNDYALLSKFLYEDELAMQAKAESQKNEKPQKPKKPNPEPYTYELGAIKV